jgi:glyoxylase-like metal-dependent hydrolase (beta-lactamase superfamily II)
MGKTPKRILKIAALVLAVLIVVPVGALVATMAGLGSVQDGAVLEGSTRVVKDGYVSLYVLEVGPGKVALVDAGVDTEGKAILAELSRRGLTADAVEAIFLTHGHTDHVAAAPRFPKARVYALAADVPLAEGRRKGLGPLPRLLPLRDTGTRVTQPLSDGDVIPVGDTTVRVFAIPGHTGGSAAYLARGVLFLGDSADAGKKGQVVPAAYIFSDDMARNRESLKQLAARLEPFAAEVRVLAFSHSGTLNGFEPLRAFAREP